MMIAWAVCRNGEVLTMASALVLLSRGSTGPADSICLADHGDVTDAVHKITARLGLSGLCGFDFVIQRSDGRAYFIELNPRATPAAHLFAEGAPDPLAILAASVGGTPQPRESVPPGIDRVALYHDGNAIHAAMSGEATYHDLPWHAPTLIALARGWAGAPGSCENGVASG